MNIIKDLLAIKVESRQKKYKRILDDNPELSIDMLIAMDENCKADEEMIVRYNL